MESALSAAQVCSHGMLPPTQDRAQRKKSQQYLADSQHSPSLNSKTRPEGRFSGQDSTTGPSAPPEAVKTGPLVNPRQSKQPTMEMEKGLNDCISSGQEKQAHSKASPSNESSCILEENPYKSTGAGRQKSEAGCVVNGLEQEEEALQQSNGLSKGSVDDKDALTEKLNNLKTGDKKKSLREGGERRESRGISARIQQTVSRRFGQQRLFGVHSEPSSFGTESSSSSVEAVDDLLPDTIADSPTKETQRGQIGSPTAEPQPARRLSKVQSNILLKQATQAAASVAAATSTSSAYPQYRGGDPNMVPAGVHHHQPHPNLPPSSGMPGYWSTNSPSGVRTPPSSGNSSMSSRTNSTCTNSTNTTNNDTMSLPPNFRVGQHNSRFRRAQQMTKVGNF
ncbi:hypothetical protein Ddc_16501 [Ditylenchus destructor]|nr:hypothetical protein Ddc_16501 [Ditylenchus destructor]